MFHIEKTTNASGLLMLHYPKQPQNSLIQMSNQTITSEIEDAHAQA